MDLLQCLLILFAWCKSTITCEYEVETDVEIRSLLRHLAPTDDESLDAGHSTSDRSWVEQVFRPIACAKDPFVSPP